MALLAAFLAPAHRAMADTIPLLTFVSSSGSITYETLSLGPPLGGGPQFNTTSNSPLFPLGSLITPGGLFPSLVPPGASNPAETLSGSLNRGLSFNATTQATDPNAPLPASYGSGTTAIGIRTSLVQGVSGPQPTQGSANFLAGTGVTDALPPGSTVASVSISTAFITFKNNTLSAINVNPGALLSVKGTVGGSAGSFVAASLFTIINPGSNQDRTSVSPIVIAAGSPGTQATPGTLALDSASASFSNGMLTGTGSSVDPISIVVAAGASITIEGILTLVADPGSSISITSSLAAGYSYNGPSPTIGITAGGLDAAAVPEPATAVLLGLGVALAGLAARSAKGRRPAIA